MANVALLSDRTICGARPASRNGCCMQVPANIVHHPDPSIYDPRLAYETGGAPTFNSPDIDTVDLWPLRPIDTFKITVRNLSSDCSSNQTRLDLSWSAWGIGMPRTALGSMYVDLARSGFPGSEGSFQWPTPPAMKTAGRYGFFVDIVHPYDSDPQNNRGEQTIDGFQTSHGRKHKFVVPVRNPTGTVQTINLTVGPPQVAPWVSLVPATVTLGPGAQHDVLVEVDVPSSVPASPPGTLISASVDVLATMGGAYLGGVNLAILFDA